MPAIAATTISNNGTATVTETTLNGTDSFVYTQGVTKYLILRNATAGALSPIIDGNGAVSEFLPGVGSVATASGYAVGSIAAGVVKTINLDSIRSYLKGDIVITGGTGLVAILAAV